MATTPQSPDRSGYPGQADPYQLQTDASSQSFIVKQLIDEIHTATLVKVTKVTNSGGVSPVGYVDVNPLVNLVDGQGTAWPQGVVHYLPYFRLQGGANAIIMDPQVGDIGLAIFASRDISSVKENKGPSNPGSYRRYDIADGLYIGGFLNGTPSQYIQFDGTGVKIHSNTKITLDAPTVAITGTTLTHNGKNVGATHTHSDPQGGVTGQPT